MMYHKTIVNKFKKNETISSMFFNHNPTRLLEPNHKGKKKKTAKNTNMEAKQHITKQPMGHQRNSKDHQNTWKQMRTKTQ